MYCICWFLDPLYYCCFYSPIIQIQRYLCYSFSINFYFFIQNKSMNMSAVYVIVKYNIRKNKYTLYIHERLKLVSVHIQYGQIPNISRTQPWYILDSDWFLTRQHVLTTSISTILVFSTAVDQLSIVYILSIPTTMQ